jgi:hypothetical protein
MEDGIEIPCSVAYAKVQSGAAVECPNGFCSGFAPVGNGQVAFVQFAAAAGLGGSGYNVLTQPILDPTSVAANLDAVNAQLLAVRNALIGQGASQDQINAFIHANSGQLISNVEIEGGNAHFSNLYAGDDPYHPELAGQPIFSFGCDFSRCDNGLDFSHAGGSNFHLDTADPFNFPVGTLVHLGVDVILGNIVTVIPRH